MLKLRCILRHCDILPGMSQTSGRGLARLACGAFYEAVNNVSNALYFFFGKCYRSSVKHTGLFLEAQILS